MMALDVLKEMIRQVEADGYKIEKPKFDTYTDNFSLIFSNPERSHRVQFDLPSYIAGMSPEELTTTVRSNYEKKVKDLSTEIMRAEAYKHGEAFYAELPEPEMPSPTPFPPPPSFRAVGITAAGAAPQPPANWHALGAGGAGGGLTRNAVQAEIRQHQATVEQYYGNTGVVRTTARVAPTRGYHEVYMSYDLAGAGAGAVPTAAPEQAPQPANPEARYRAPVWHEAVNDTPRRPRRRQ